MYRVIFLLFPPKFVIWLGFSLSARDYKGILYLENFGGTSKKNHPVLGVEAVLAEFSSGVLMEASSSRGGLLSALLGMAVGLAGVVGARI